jgi:predicted  nucleic acid-binding Zn-ribbon protein
MQQFYAKLCNELTGIDPNGAIQLLGKTCADGFKASKKSPISLPYCFQLRSKLISVKEVSITKLPLNKDSYGAERIAEYLLGAVFMPHGKGKDKTVSTFGEQFKVLKWVQGSGAMCVVPEYLQEPMREQLGKLDDLALERVEGLILGYPQEMSFRKPGESMPAAEVSEVKDAVKQNRQKDEKATTGVSGGKQLGLLEADDITTKELTVKNETVKAAGTLPSDSPVRKVQEREQIYPSALRDGRDQDNEVKQNNKWSAKGVRKKSFESFFTQINNIQQYLDQLESENSRGQKKIEYLESQLEFSEKEARNKGDQVLRLRRELDKKISHYKSQEVELTRLRKNSESLEKERADLAEEKERLEKAAQEARRKHKEEIEYLSGKIEPLIAKRTQELTNRLRDKLTREYRELGHMKEVEMTVNMGNGALGFLESVFRKLGEEGVNFKN